MPRNFANFLSAYADYTKASESPRYFHFWTAVSTIAGAVRRRVWWDEKIFQWTPNFYVILVAPPGVVQKSTSIDLGIRLLREVPGIKFGPESLTWQGLADAMADAVEFIDWIPLGGDPVKDLQTIPMSPVTCAVSELGTFLNTEDGKLMSVLTTMWDSRTIPFVHRTLTQKAIEVRNPWLNVIAATTPSWIQNNIPPHLIGDGLLSRVVFVYENQKRHLVARPSKLIHSVAFRDLEKKLIEDLIHISELKGIFDLDGPADRWYEDWYAKHNDPNKRPIHLASDRFGGYISRKQGHLTKLSMILSIAQRDTLIITKDDLEAADQLLLHAEQSMLSVFNSIGGSEEQRRVAAVVSYVRAYGFLKEKELYQLVYNTMSRRDYEEALKAAIFGDLLKIVIKGADRGLAPVVKIVN